MPTSFAAFKPTLPAFSARHAHSFSASWRLGVLWNVLLPFRFSCCCCHRCCCRTHPHCVPHCVLTSLGHLAGTLPHSPTSYCSCFCSCHARAFLLLLVGGCCNFNEAAACGKQRLRVARAMKQLALFMLQDETMMVAWVNMGVKAKTGCGRQGGLMMMSRLPLLNELYMTAGVLGRKLQLHLGFLQRQN